MFPQLDNGFVQTMVARDQNLQMANGSSVIGPNSVPSSSNSSSASGVHPSSLLVHHLPVIGPSMMMPYMRPLFQVPMTYDNIAPHYFMIPAPMDSGRLSEYINPLMTHRIHQAQLAHQFPLGRVTNSYKTVMCQSWLETATCKFGEECKFAHGEPELRFARPPIRNPKKYKTRYCEKYTVRGCCPYGNRCLFIHPEPSQMLGVTPPAGVGMTLDNYKNYVVVPQPNLMMPPASPFPDVMSIESSQFHYRVIEAPNESTTKNGVGGGGVVDGPSEVAPPSPHLSVRSANGGDLSTGEPVPEEEKQQDVKQVLRDMLRRDDKQRREAVATDSSPTTIEKPEEESTDDKKKSQQQNVSFNESGQRESLAYTLANVLDISDSSP